MKTAVLFALLAARGLAVRIEKSALREDPKNLVEEDPKNLVDGIKVSMEQTRMDFHAQATKCGELYDIAFTDRDESHRVADKWLTAGLYDVLAQGLLNILAVPESAASEDELYQAAEQCFNAIPSAGVKGDERKAVLMYRNSPHVWDAMVGFFERFRSKVIVPRSPHAMCVLAGMYGSWGVNERDSHSEISLGLERAGGFKFILDVLEHNYTEPEIFQAATCALSDHLAGSKAAPKILADNYDGINLLMNGVRHAQGATPFYQGDNPGYPGNFGLRYEILEDVTGLLKNDDNGRFTKRFGEEGLMEEVIKLMPQEPNDLYFQDHCCQVFSWLTNSNPSAQHELAHSAAAQLVQKVVTEPCGPTCFWPAPLSPYLKVSDPPPSCMFLYTNLHGYRNTQWKDWSMDEPQP